MRPKLSISSVGMFQTCALAYWFGHIQKVPSKTDYPRILGIAVHRFINHLYTGVTYPLFYENIDKARGAWFGQEGIWKGMLAANKKRIKFPDKKKEHQYGAIGWSCIEKYWNKNIDKPKPIEREQPYEMIIHGIWWLIGTIDQVRRISPEAIARIQPELIKDGKLIDGYAPVIIVDLKSGRGSWDLTDYAPDASLLEMAAHQFELHDNLQATAYWELYHKSHRKMPVGFYSYQLQSGKTFLTFRTEDSYPILHGKLDEVISGIEKEKFPMTIGDHCKYCDYIQPCVAIRPNRPLYVSKPSEGIPDEGFKNVEIRPKNIKVQKARQLSLGLKIPETTTINPTAGSATDTTPGFVEIADPQIERLEKFLADDEGENPIIITLPSLDGEKGGSDGQFSP